MCKIINDFEKNNFYIKIIINPKQKINNFDNKNKNKIQCTKPTHFCLSISISKGLLLI